MPLADRRPQGRFRHWARRLQHAHSGVQVVRRRQHLLGRRTRRAAPYADECHPTVRAARSPTAAGQYMTNKSYKRVFFLAADYQAGKEHIEAAIRTFKGEAIGPFYTPLPQLDFAPEISRIRAEKPDAVFSFLVGSGGIAFSKQYSQGGLDGSDSVRHRGSGRQPVDLPAQGDAALGIIMATNWHMDSTTRPTSGSSIPSATGTAAIPATFAALGYDAIKAIMVPCAASTARSRIRTRCAPPCAKPTSTPCAASSNSTTTIFRSRTCS